MEWTIPIQKLEVGKVHIGSMLTGAKPLVPLSYTDGQVQFPSLSLFLPQLTVKTYEPQTGRLDISMRESAQTHNKLHALQNTLLSAVNTHQTAWFADSQRSQAELQQLFQPMIEGDTLHLYCPVTIQEKRLGGTDSIVVFRSEKGGPVSVSHGVRHDHMKPGDTLRIALRIQGISFHNHPAYGQWTGKFRLQHRIVALYVNS
jgi:hypothetical protein